jgi:HSP20 family molecular chaperone IbpA
MIITRPLITRNPWITSLEQVNRLLQEQLHGTTPERSYAWRSYETTDSWQVEIDLPGIARDQIELKIHPKEISLKWSETHSATLDLANLVPTPEEIDAPAVTATHQDGVLKIHLPKKAAEEIVRTIQIQ